MNKIKKLVDDIIADGIVTDEEHGTFLEAIHLDGVIDCQEQEQITRIYNLLKQSKIRVEEGE